MHSTLTPRANIHPKVVSERLGHATISITLDIHSHVIPAPREEGEALVARLVSAAKQRRLREPRGGNVS